LEIEKEAQHQPKASADAFDKIAADAGNLDKQPITSNKGYQAGALVSVTLGH